jgi:hypothetical protein
MPQSRRSVAVAIAVGVVVLGALVAATPVGGALGDGAADFAFGGRNATPPQVPSTAADVSRCPWLEHAPLQPWLPGC